MASVLTPTPSSPGSTDVVAPEGGDARTAASVRVPLGSLVNMVAWLYGVLIGTISQNIQLLGGLHGTYAAFSGNVIVSGVGALLDGKVCPRIVYGDPTSGVHLYDPVNQNYIVMNPSGSSVASGCVWKINGIGFENEPMVFRTLDSTTPITIQDPTGATLATLIASAGGMIEAGCYYVGGSWVLLRPVYR